MNFFQRLLRRPFFIRLLHWEYWSFDTLYAAMYPVWLLFCLRARSFFFFSASNPSIHTGGFLCESKKDIYAIMPAHLYPATVYFEAGQRGQEVLQHLRHHGFQYPVIGKPDIGGRGRGIKILRSDEEVQAYAAHTVVDFHIQKFVSYPEEAGIFYVRIPGEERGRLTGIVSKDFLTVVGDGRQTMRSLLLANERYVLQLPSLERMFGPYLDTVLPAGEKKVLVPYGNHARGARFLDDSHLIDEALTSVIDNVCWQVKDFYFGRLDIRYNTWEELRQGRNFCVIEVNGAGSEPTHIYDPRHSLFFAWGEIIRHWIWLSKISRANHRRGYPYMSFRDGVKMFREDRLHSKKLAAMPE